MVRVIFRPISDGDAGYYDRDDDTICIARGMGRATTYCTVEHERTHMLLGHQPLNDLARHLARELAVDRLTALRIIPFPSLLAAATRHTGTADRCRFLGVDHGTYTARILALSPLEQTMIEVCGRYCIGVGTPAALRRALTSVPA